MSSTPETTGPELSIDEITSTRLSLDDQDILTNLPEESDLKETHSRKLVLKTALSSVWGEHSDKLKRMTKRLKKLPNGIFARRDPLERELTTMMNPAPLREPTLPCIDFATDLFVPTTGRMPSIEETEGVDQPETLVRFLFAFLVLLTDVSGRWIMSASQWRVSRAPTRCQRYDLKRQAGKLRLTTIRDI